MVKKREVPKDHHIVKEHIAENPERYKNIGERIDDKLKKSLKKSGLW